MNIEEKIELYLENSNEEKAKAKKLVDHFF